MCKIRRKNREWKLPCKIVQTTVSLFLSSLLGRAFLIGLDIYVLLSDWWASLIEVALSCKCQTRDGWSPCADKLLDVPSPLAPWRVTWRAAEVKLCYREARSEYLGGKVFFFSSLPYDILSRGCRAGGFPHNTGWPAIINCAWTIPEWTLTWSTQFVTVGRTPTRPNLDSTIWTKGFRPLSIRVPVLQMTASLLMDDFSWGATAQRWPPNISTRTAAMRIINLRLITRPWAYLTVAPLPPVMVGSRAPIRTTGITSTTLTTSRTQCTINHRASPLPMSDQTTGR